jgi:hypothetical protein
MTGMSVVIANQTRDPARAAVGVPAMRRELADDDEVVWVDAARLDAVPGLAPARTLRAPVDAGRGHCYGLGLTATRRDLVAFTDSSTVVERGWRMAAVAALDRGATVVGGPVLPSAPRSMPAWAGFLVDYAAHALPPYASAGGDVAANNVAYRRSALPTDGRPVWKHQVNSELRALGVDPVVAPGMRVTVHREYRWADLAARFRSGCLYAVYRSRGWARGRRLLAGAGCSLLPALALGRLCATVRHDDLLRRKLLASLPAVILATTSWSAGEAVGYLFRRPQEGAGVW